MAGHGEDVYCTLVMSDSYLQGALVLAHSLRDAGTAKKLAALITLDTLGTDTISQLKNQFDFLIPVQRIANPNPSNLFLMDRSDLLFAFTKIALWRQTQFRKLVYMDADTVALRAPDELFDLDVPFAAAPDVGWPDAFNTGMMVVKPNMGDYWALQTLASTGDSFDGADQGLLNQYYQHRNWHRLSFTYNCTPNAQYQWEPAYRHYKSNISVVHFIGKNKPWRQDRSRKGTPGVYNELLSRWWAVYDRHLRDPAQSLPTTLNGQSTISSAQPVTSLPHPNQATSNEPPVIAVEEPFTEPENSGEYIEQSLSESNTGPPAPAPSAAPAPTPQQAPFEAPAMQWDATRSAPPPETIPEASNFPSQQYTFSEDKGLFKAPQYPEPPKNMWYEVPETKPAVHEKPKPIFPWEREREQPKATRVFAEDFASPPAPEPESAPALESELAVESEPTEAPSTNEQAGPLVSPPNEASSSSSRSDEPWKTFEQSANAWDTVPGIDKYVRAVMRTHRRGQSGGASGNIEELLSPTGHSGTPRAKPGLNLSLKLTDFPTADDRPSLPVTPAPIRRPTFWGAERDEEGELPAADGVPAQSEWVCPRCGFSDRAISFIRRARHPVNAASSASMWASFSDRKPSDQTTTTFGTTSPEAGAVPAFASPPTTVSLTESVGEPPMPPLPSHLTYPPSQQATSTTEVPTASKNRDPSEEAGSHDSQDPSTQLEQLRRNSLLELEHLKLASDHANKIENRPEEHPGTYVDGAGRKLSLRAMPEHAMPVGPKLKLPPARNVEISEEEELAENEGDAVQEPVDEAIQVNNEDTAEVDREPSPLAT